MTAGTEPPRCRACGAGRLRPFLSLGKTPLADALLDPSRLDAPEPRFPLDVAFCARCSLVQILEEVPPEKLFVENYLYFSSFSDHLLRHSREHAQGLVAARALDRDSLVVEIASNDGYLLRNFAEHGVRVLGVDPAPDQAAAAEAAGVPTVREFFGAACARRLRDEHGPADVVIANNVMAHVPDLAGFVEGLRILVAGDGIITVENPYVRDLIERREFDTIYHEHFCYYSCTAVDNLVRRHGLYLNDVAYFPDLHGGTLRWSIGPQERVTATVREYLRDERERGVTAFGYYRDFSGAVERIRADLRALLEDLRGQGATIAGYGAAAKGSTLLNYAGIGRELVQFVVDRNPHKQGKHMPGTHQPILPPEALRTERPDYVLLLAWNFREEIVAQQAGYLAGGGRFVVPVPEPEVVG